MTSEEMGRCLTRLRMVLTQWAPKEIDRDICAVWLTVLRDFPDQQIKESFLKAASELTEFPAPATIKRLCQGSNKTNEEIGQEICSRIEGAIRMFGGYSPERARPYIGELGWEVVKQYGGWSNVCRLEDDDLPSARKQWRETAALVSKNFFTAGKNTPPELPEKKSPILESALKLAIGSKGFSKAVNE